MGVAVTGFVRNADMRDFWEKRLKSGNVPKPEYVYVPVDEQYLTGVPSTNRRYDPENCWRELFGRHRCIACGKPFWSQEAAFDCHSEATASIVWDKFANTCQVGSASPTEALMTAIYASSGGPYGL